MKSTKFFPVSVIKFFPVYCLIGHRVVLLDLAHDVRHAEFAVAEPDVYAFPSACEVESERLGPGSGHLGCNQQESDFAGVTLFQLVVCEEKSFSLASK